MKQSQFFKMLIKNFWLGLNYFYVYEEYNKIE
jgi:hypothetical protein